MRNAKRVLDRMSELAGHLIVSEVVPKAGGLWHVHIHGVVVLSDGSDFLDYSQMIELWRRFEPEGVYASGQNVRSEIGYASYIVGYIAKPMFRRRRVSVFDRVDIDYSVSRIADLLKLLRGCRLWRTSGSLYNRGRQPLGSPECSERAGGNQRGGGGSRCQRKARRRSATFLFSTSNK